LELITVFQCDLVNSLAMVESKPVCSGYSYLHMVQINLKFGGECISVPI